MGMIINYSGHPITPPIVFPSEIISAQKFSNFSLVLLIDCTIIYNHDFSMTIQIIDIPGLFNSVLIENSIIFISFKSLYILSKIPPLIQIKKIIKTNLMIADLSNCKFNHAKHVLANNEIDISIVI
ncbi:hypothetical protein MXB_1217 [Myxobolus squamalis]|nr:hypothetical protein MXB_1217 [Myxobolus squamalis]